MVPIGERPRPDIDVYGVTHAWRSEPSAYDDTGTRSGLHLQGETIDGRFTKVVTVAEDAAFRGFRERVAAIRVGMLLLLNRADPL